MSASTPKKNSFFGGAAILTAGIIIVKLIGALYKIPLGNVLSDAGFADFNTAYDIYSMLIVISTGGLPVALSKMVSEANARGRVNQVNKVYRLSLVAFCVMGTLSFLVMAVFPRQLSELMNNSRSYWSILALAPAVFFICPLSAMRGYFQGHSLMTPTAVSQIIEALCKLAIGLPLAYLIMKNLEGVFQVSEIGSQAAVGAVMGVYAAVADVSQTAEIESRAAGGAILGVSAGVLLAMLYTFWCFRGHQKRQKTSQDEPDSSREILRTLVKLAVPITIGASIVSVTNIFDSAILMNRLQVALNMTEDAARTLKGMYNKTMTLYNLPSSFMVPLTASVIPTVSAARELRNYKQGALISETTLRTTALLSLPAGVGLFVLGKPIIYLLYPATEDIALAGWMLSVLGIASIAVCFMLVSNSIMQAHKLVTLPMVTTLIGCLLKLIVGYVLTGIPEIGIKGGAISTVVCFGIVAILDLVIIKLTLPRSLSYFRVFSKPAAATAVMGLSAWAVCGLLSKALVKIGAFQTKNEAGQAMLSWNGNALAVAAAIGVAVVVYVALILLTKAISKEDLSLMPKGDKIARLLRIK